MCGPSQKDLKHGMISIQENIATFLESGLKSDALCTKYSRPVQCPLITRQMDFAPFHNSLTFTMYYVCRDFEILD